jgi:hypothetical protein
LKRSPSNSSVATSKCVFEFKPYPSQTDEYQSVIYDVCYKAKEESFSIAYIANEPVTDETRFDIGNSNAIRGSVYHTLLSAVTERERIDQSSTLFKQTVMELLQLSRALCFS